MKNIKKELSKLNWEKYHWTRELLLSAIDVHLKSIKLVNVYNNGSRTDIPLNTSGDYCLMNQSMGVNELNKLKERLTIDK
tara:strand:- start:288 stop:527 length:240 start_codon:yes stop_codon:yes gene_type:complete